jgi:hypothetical protein
MRTLPRRVYMALKTATRRMVDNFGGQDAVAASTRVSQKQISRYVSAKEPNNKEFMPIDVLADIISEGKDLTVLRELASLADCQIIELPEMADGFADLQVAMGKSAKEFGEMFSSIGKSIADGEWDAVERRGDLKEIDDMLLAVLALKKLAEQGIDDE